MYHATGTGLAIVILYTLSFILYRNGFFTLQQHRKLWNLVLALAFTFTALAGVLLALQITNKWNIPAVEIILKWHVETGIVLAVTGFLHLAWHYSYFSGMFKRSLKRSDRLAEMPPAGKAEISVNLFIIGLISSSVQLLLLKEIMNIAGGYELVTGTFLCSWLLGSATGSSLARQSKPMNLKKINSWFSSGPVISLFLMLFLTRVFLKTGETPSFIASAIYTFLALMPFCLLSGFAFVMLVSAARASGISPGRSFSVETTGGILAGILVSILSSGIMNTYQCLLIIIAMSFAYTFLTYYIHQNRVKLIIKITFAGLTTCIILFSPDILFRKLLLGGLEITETVDTPYGNITWGLYNNERSVYYNQRLLAYSHDAIESEEDIHYAMLQSDKPETVLLISGNTSSRLKEIEKYNVKKIICVERDPTLAKASEQNFPGSHAYIIKNDDAISYIKKTSEKFDVVILLLPSPSSLSLNRYFTTGFFSTVREKMNPGAVFACSPGINPNYFNKEAVNLYSSIYNSLKTVFSNVLPIGGDKLYFIASEKQLTTSITRLAAEKNIINAYVSPDYLSDDLIELKTGEIYEALDPHVRMNTYDRPIATFHYQNFNLSKNYNANIPAIVLLLGVFTISLLSIRGDSGIMYFSALALAGFEIILLLMLQVSVGNMYQVTGLILAGLMAGLAVGSGLDLPFFRGRKIVFRVIILLLLYVLAALALPLVPESDNRFASVLVIMFAGFLPAMITGSIYKELTSANSSRGMVSTIYSADLSGSAVGFLFFSGLIVPVLGLSMSLLTLPVLVCIGLLLMIIGKKQGIL